MTGEELELFFAIEDVRIRAEVRSPTLRHPARRLYLDYRAAPLSSPAPAAAPDLELMERDGGAGEEGSGEERTKQEGRTEGDEHPVEPTPTGGSGRFRVRSSRGEWTMEDPESALSRFDVTLGELLLEAMVGTGTVHPLHAGGVVGANGALLLVGPGGAGKSTVTAALALEGYPVLGDDVVLLCTKSGRVRSFRRHMKLIPPAPELLGLPCPHGPGETLWEDVSYLLPEELGSRWAEPAAARHVVLLRFEPDAPSNLFPVQPGRAFQNLLPQLLYTEPGTATTFADLADTLAHARFHHLSFSRPRGAVERLARLLDPDRCTD